MRRNGAPLQAAKAKTKLQSGVDDPGFRALLDHLGRLLAQEYVELLRKNRAAEAEPTKGGKPMKAAIYDSNSARGMPLCLMIDKRVPVFSSG